MSILVARVLGFVLLAAGVLGFFSGAELMGFGINALHNGVHIVSGLLGLAAGFAGLPQARLYCLLFGVVYGVVTVLGFAGVPLAVHHLNLNHADNWLHLAITAVCFIVYGADKARADK